MKKRGFTLIELMVVMAIIAVLAMLIVGAIILARNTATETTHRSNVRTIETALEADFAKHRSYCADTATAGRLTCGTSYSLQAAATQITNVTLASAATAGTCAGTGNHTGGGRITTLTKSSYIIGVANNACSAYTSKEDLVCAGVAAASCVLPTY